MGAAFILKKVFKDFRDFKDLKDFTAYFIQPCTP